MSPQPTTITLTPATIEALPDDPKQLKAMLAELLKALHDLQLEKEHLRQIIQLMRRKLYGRKSERIDPNQLNLFPDEEEPKPSVVEGENEVEIEEAQQEKKRRRKERTKTDRNPFPANLPREIRHTPLSSEERQCKCCGKERVKIGEETTEKLEYIPASYKIVVIIQGKYMCPECEKERRKSGNAPSDGVCNSENGTPATAMPSAADSASPPCTTGTTIEPFICTTGTTIEPPICTTGTTIESIVNGVVQPETSHVGATFPSEGRPAAARIDPATGDIILTPTREGEPENEGFITFVGKALLEAGTENIMPEVPARPSEAIAPVS